MNLLCEFVMSLSWLLLNFRTTVQSVRDMTYLGCFKDVQISTGDDFHFENLDWPNKIILPDDCAAFCIYSKSNVAQSAFTGLHVHSRGQLCLCLKSIAVLSVAEEKHCNSSCFNPAETCIRGQYTKIWSLCRPGTYSPPLCEAKCPYYCKENEDNAKACGYAGECTHGCVNNLCQVRYNCQSISGLGNIESEGGLQKVSAETSFSGVYLFPQSRISQSGTVTHLSYFAQAQGDSYISVWRFSEVNMDNLVLVHKVLVRHSGALGPTQQQLQPSEMFHVETGDILGVHQVGFNGTTSSKIIFAFYTSSINSGVHNMFSPDMFDKEWSSGYQIHQDQLSKDPINNIAYHVQVTLHIECTCSPGCQQGMCGTGGICSQGCLPGWSGLFCNISCEVGKFGADCTRSCSPNCRNKACNEVHGSCTSGCEDGFLGRDCQVPCLPTTYGLDCLKQCSNNCAGSLCDNRNGNCLTGCVEGFQMPTCEVFCDPGMFGQACVLSCGHCLHENSCRSNTGECEGGCKDGYAPPRCVDPCPSDSFGLNCNQHCGKCKHGVTCDPVTGQCPDLCAPGYNGVKCTELCRPGYYGADCELECGYCQGNANCRVTDGTCETGCIEGYVPPLCQQRCLSGKFGDHCLFSCGKCKNGQACSRVDGYCSEGCMEGYKPPTCRCPALFYGVNCDKKCGECRSNTDCDEKDGSCPRGCVNSSLAAPLCLTNVFPSCRDGFYGENCTKKCGHCKTSSDGSSWCQKFDGACADGCEEGYRAPLCTHICPPRLYGEGCIYICGMCTGFAPCHHITGYCPRSCQAGFQMPLCILNCKPGFYGPSCRYRCGFCEQGTCNSVTGVCLGLCQKGWHGRLCQYSLEHQSALISLSANQNSSSNQMLCNPTLIIAVLFSVFPFWIYLV